MRWKIIGVFVLGAVILVAAHFVERADSGDAAVGQKAASKRPSPSLRSARSDAMRDARRRLQALQLPPGAQRVSRLPRALHLGAPSTEPDTPNLVQRHSSFVTSQPSRIVLAWFRAHSPGDLKLTESGSYVIRNEIVVRDLGFSWSDREEVQDRRLLVSVAARPDGGSAFRADSQAVWITPHDPIPPSTGFIGIEFRRDGILRKKAAIADPAEVSAISQVIDDLEATTGVYSCPEIPTSGKSLVLVFRSSASGPELAKAVQSLPPGCGRPLELTIGGERQPNLGEGSLMLRRLRTILARAKARPLF
jgi:hypothetical protein